AGADRRFLGWCLVVIGTTGALVLATATLMSPVVSSAVNVNHQEQMFVMIRDGIVFALCGVAIWFGWSMTARTAHEAMQMDRRSPILYLRAFADDNTLA